MKKCMTNTRMKLLKPISSLALCLCMIVSCLPISAYAETADGYVHEHTDACEHSYGAETTESTEASAPACTAEDVKAMIDALPDVSELESMSEDELNEAYEKAQDAYDAFEALTDEEQIELANDLVKLRDVLDFMTTLVAPLATEAGSFPTDYVTYSSGVTQYFKYKNYLYKVTYTNLNTSKTVKFTYQTSTNYLMVFVEGYNRNLKTSGGVNLKISDIPQTQGAVLECYCKNYNYVIDTSKPVVTLTCLKINSTPTWSWSGDYSSASAVFKATDHDVQATVGATVSKKILKYAADCTEKNTVEYTATVSFGGVSASDTKTAVNGEIGPHNLTYSASGNTITEYCNNGCGHEDTAALTVDPSASLLYTGSAVKPLKVAYSGDWLGGDLEIKYADDCIDLGSHSAGITIGGVTATQTFEITTPTVVTKSNCTSLGLNSSHVGYYAISTLDELKCFAVLAVQDPSVNAVLLRDIDATSISYIGIGKDASHAFAGTFDGNSKTLKLALVSTEQYVAPFPHVNGATIRDLTVSGTIKTTHKFAAGIVGRVESGNAKLENCLSLVEIDSTNYSGDGTHGGLIGVAAGTTTINNCGFAGSIIGTTTTSCAGIVGWTDSNVITNISNSYVSAYFDLSGNNGNTFGRNPTYVKLTNCYYLYALSDASTATQMSAESFASGEVAYKLNGGVTNGTQTWYQTCQSDSYPKLSGETVYTGYVCGSGSSDPVYRNSMDGLLTFASPEHKYDASGACENCGTTQAYLWDETEQVYKIYHLVQLQWFADHVNAGNTNINGKLMADIDASSAKNLGIGTSSKKYAGTFDGNGYTITFWPEGSESVALFPYVNGATIRNLTVKGYIWTTVKYTASLVGQAEGEVTIERCISMVQIASTVSGDGTHGGLVGVLNSGTLNINNCGFSGKITGFSTDSCGGLVGWSNGTTNISNSFVSATFGIKGDGGSTFSGGNNITITNCYYLNALGTEQGTQMTAAQLASGEAAWLLNGSKDNGTWKQTIGTDSYPNFSGGAVYKITPCELGYTNNEAEKDRDHVVENGTCKYCGKIFDLASAVWNESKQAYEIYSSTQLVWFSKLVNGTLEGAAQNQSANAILMADIDMSRVTDYVPIGGAIVFYDKTEGDNKGYQGTFDGNGHVIKNLSVKEADTAYLTYGVFSTLSGTVKHLGVENFTFTRVSSSCYAGGIAGQVLSGGLVEDCYVANSTITATGFTAGGIAGGSFAGTIKNCFAYKVTTTATATGGIVGKNCGNNNSDRKGSVINCYTDASAIEGSSYKGNVSSSTAGMSAGNFASGYVGFLLDGSRDLWKQTIGAQSYPTFNGDTIKKIDGYNIEGKLISAKITWTAMEFTYTADGGSWDPTTHSYNGSSEGTWSVVDGGGTVTVENLGDQSFYTRFAYTSNVSGVTGTFDMGKTEVKSNQSVTSKLTLAGAPDSRNAVLGWVDIIISLTWAVGDEVTWVGADGKAYTCYVASISESNYVLITKNSVKTCTKDDLQTKINEAVNSTGGSIPSFISESQKECLKKIASSQHKVIVLHSGKKCWNGSSTKPTQLSMGKTYYIHIVFDVSIS